jgi:acyl-coenzyme A thioesterase 9
MERLSSNFVFYWQVSNTFYFTFTLDPEYLKGHKEHPVRKVLPATEEEACNYLARYDADHLSIHPYIRY